MAQTPGDFYRPVQHIIDKAIEEARQLRHDYLGTEHILLALVADEDSTVTKALSGIGLTPERIRAAIGFVVVRGSCKTNKVSLDPSAERAIAIALRVAHRLGSDQCGAKHMFVGILAQGESMGARILHTMAGQELDKVKDEIIGSKGEPDVLSEPLVEQSKGSIQKEGEPMAAKAFVLIETNVGKTGDVVAKIRRLEGVRSVDIVTGPYDVIAVVEAKSLNDIGVLITEKIHNIAGISRTVTCLVIT